MSNALSITRLPAIVIPFVALVFAIAHLAFEHFNGGVKTHHFMASGDLPGFSNWLGLLILPTLGIALAVRIRKLQNDGKRMPRSVVMAFIGASLYGVMLSVSFHFKAEQLSFLILIGLFILALALPVYRAEYSLGLVVGMTVVFGPVIPLVLALFFAAISWTARTTMRFMIKAYQSRRK
jgi:hypothetical protein